MPGSTPATSQLDWLSSTTAMIVLSWSKATRDLLKSFSGGIRGTPSVICQRRWCHLLRRLPHTISPVEESGFEPLVPATWTTPARPSPGAHSRSGRRDQLVQRGDRRFASPFLQRGVACEPDSQGLGFKRLVWKWMCAGLILAGAPPSGGQLFHDLRSERE